MDEGDGCSSFFDLADELPGVPASNTDVAAFVLGSGTTRDLPMKCRLGLAF